MGEFDILRSEVKAIFPNFDEAAIEAVLMAAMDQSAGQQAARDRRVEGITPAAPPAPMTDEELRPLAGPPLVRDVSDAAQADRLIQFAPASAVEVPQDSLASQGIGDPVGIGEEVPASASGLLDRMRATPAGQAIVEGKKDLRAKIK